LNEELRVVERITDESSRTFESTGGLLLPNGEVAATGFGTYLHMPLSKTSDFDPLEQEWKVVRSEKDHETINL
jgi:hypothetical protein